MKLIHQFTHVIWLACVFAYITMRIIVMGMILSYHIHLKPVYCRYVENMAEANNVWKMI